MKPERVACRALTVMPSDTAASSCVEVSVSVTNTGGREGRAVQLDALRNERMQPGVEPVEFVVDVGAPAIGRCAARS